MDKIQSVLINNFAPASNPNLLGLEESIILQHSRHEAGPTSRIVRFRTLRAESRVVKGAILLPGTLLFREGAPLVRYL